MNTRKNDPNEQLDRIVGQIRDERIDPAAIRGAAERVARRLRQGSAGERRADLGPDTIQGCADVRALLPAFVAGTLPEGKALLVGDHTRECISCRRSLREARSGSVATPLAFPARGGREKPVLRWLAAAVIFTGALAAGTLAYRNLPVDPARSAVEVRSVEGALYRITGNWSSSIGAGEEIAGGQVFRTAKGSRAVVRLADGSDVEMNERSELSVSARRAGTTLHLSRGSIIVQASDQGSKHLYVATSDCRVAVTGTIFSVNHGTKGSRVSVIEGEVHVERSGARDVLHPGDQVSTTAALGRVSLASEIAWSRDAGSHLALLAELTQLRRELEQIPPPAVRHDTRLLDLAPEGTVVYAAIPNVGTALGEAHRIFRDRIEQSPVLQEWWRQTMAPGGADGEIDDAIRSLRAFGEQVKDEIVFTISAEPDGRFDAVVALAELADPAGFPDFLARELERLPASERPRVIENPAAEPPNAEGKLLIWVHDDLVAVSPSLPDLRRLQASIAGGTGGFPSSSFRASLARSYEEGTSFLLGVDLEKILSASSAAGAPSADTLRNAGLLDVRHLVVEGKESEGTGLWRAALGFEGSRRGVASWLAAPAPMGSLEFISPDAMLAAAFVTKDPVAMVHDLFGILGASQPDFADHLAAFQEEHGVDVLRDLAAPLGGEVALALDGPLLPTPAWKLIVEVYDPEALERAIEWAVTESNRANVADAPPGLRIDREDAGGRTWYAIRSSRIPAEVHYAFVDGYLVAGPSRSLVETAIAIKNSGAALPESPRFTGLLPRGDEANFSAIVYQNLAPLAGALAPALGAAGGPAAGGAPDATAKNAIRTLLGDARPTLAYAYGEPDRIVAASTRSGGLFGTELGMLFSLNGLAGAHDLIRHAAEAHDGGEDAPQP